MVVDKPQKSHPKERSAKSSNVKGEAEKTVKWVLIDAKNKVLGRLAVQVANFLSGKNLPEYCRHKDMGAHVVVVNAANIRVTGNKRADKRYKFFSSYPSGLKEKNLDEMLLKKPGYPIRHAVQGMLPKNHLGNQMMKKLFVYADAVHPHVAQHPEPVSL